MRKPLKIALVASAGGHLTQLLKVADAWAGQSAVCVTTSEVVRRKLEPFGPVYVVGECNREHLLETAKVFGRCIKIVWRERPGVVISTGAAPGCLVCLLGKLFGAKVVWLDSIANTERLSLSGRMVRPFADLILSQWPDVASRYRNVEYAGAVI